MELNQDEEKVKGVVPVLACVLQQLCTANDDLSFDPKKAVSKFHALCIPTLGIKGYLERIAKYSGCSPECFVLCLVYIDRIIQSRGFIVNSYSIHRLLITGTMLAAKFFDDHYYNNAYYAKVGGVNADEMNALEVEFLFMLNFHLYVSTRTYKLYYQELFAHTTNPKAVCGCAGLKVPQLIFPFPSTPDEKSKFVLTDTSDTSGQDLHVSDDDDDDDFYDDDPEEESKNENKNLDDSKNNNKIPTSDSVDSYQRQHNPTEKKINIPKSISQPISQQPILQKSSSQQSQQQQQQIPTSQSSYYPSQEKQQPQGQPVVASTSQPYSRDLLGWQSPISRKGLPDQNVDNLTSQETKLIRTRSLSPPKGTNQNIVLSQTMPEKVVERIGRKGSDYTLGTGEPTTTVKNSTLQQTQFWRLQQQLQQSQQGRILIPNGGIPIQKSASATYPSQSTSFQPQSMPQQQQPPPQQQQPSHKLRRGLSSVQSVVVK